MTSVYIGFRVPKEIDDLIIKRIKELKLESKSDYFKYLLARDLKEAGYGDALEFIRIMFKGDVVE